MILVYFWFFGLEEGNPRLPGVKRGGVLRGGEERGDGPCPGFRRLERPLVAEVRLCHLGPGELVIAVEELVEFRRRHVGEVPLVELGLELLDRLAEELYLPLLREEILLL